MMKGTAALTAAAIMLLAVAACSHTQTVGRFKPAGAGPASAGAGGGEPSAAVAPSGYVMPAFGKNVRIEMTSRLPANAAQAKAVNTDKDYELAFLYSEYRGGQDLGWVSYVSPVMQAAVQQGLRAKSVTTESFTGTIRYFDMRVIPDPLVHGDLDVSTCFDNAKSSNTNLTTGAVLPEAGSPDSHYVRIADELRKNSAGQWQVVSSLPAVYYPRARECKP